jgi:hypothetical protein
MNASEVATTTDRAMPTGRCALVVEEAAEQDAAGVAQAVAP